MESGFQVDFLVGTRNPTLFEIRLKPSQPPGHSSASDDVYRWGGLSGRVVVIEAAEKSGSLIPASAALEQGKEVFLAFPVPFTEN